ncbi:hypothetical protein CHS0354_017224, partial [Potamilus streckersoni]
MTATVILQVNSRITATVILQLPSRRKLAHEQECNNIQTENQEIDMTMSWPRNVRQSKRRRSEYEKICNDDLSRMGDGQTCSSLNLLPEDKAEEQPNRSTRSKGKKKANMKLESQNENVNKMLKEDNQTMLLSAIERIDTASRKNVKDGLEPGSSSQSELLKYIETGICGGHIERFDNEVTPNLKFSTGLRETRSDCKIHKIKCAHDCIEATEFSQTESKVQVTNVSKADSESSGQHSLFKTPVLTIPNFTNAEVPMLLQSCQTELVDYNEEHDPVTEAIMCASPDDNDWHKVDPVIDEHNKVAQTYSRKNRCQTSHSSKVTDWLNSLPGETSEMKAPESHDLIVDKPNSVVTMRNRKGKKEDKLRGKIGLLSSSAKGLKEDIEHMFGFDDLVSNPSQMKQKTVTDESRSMEIKITNMSEEGSACISSGNIFENMNNAFHKHVHCSSEMVKQYVKDKEIKNNKQISSNITSYSAPFTKDKPENTRLPAAPDKSENTKAQAISNKMMNNGSSVMPTMTVNTKNIPVMSDHIDNIRKTITSDEIEVMGNMKPVVHGETGNTAKAVTLNEKLNNSSIKMICGSGNGWTVELTKEQRMQLEEPKRPLPLQRRRIFKVMGRSFQPDITEVQTLPKELLLNETCKLHPVCTVDSAVNTVEQRSDPYEFKASPKAMKEQKGKKKRRVKNREKQSNKVKNPVELMIKTVSVRNNMERSQKRNPDLEVMIIQETPDLRFMSEKKIPEDDSSDNQVKDRWGKIDTNRNIFPTNLENCTQKKKSSPKIAAAMKSKEEMQKLVNKISEAEEYDLLTCTQDAVQSLERQQSSHSVTPNVAMETQDVESIISVSCMKKVRFMEPLDSEPVRGQGQSCKVEQGQQVPKGIVKNKKNAKEPHNNESFTDASVEKTRQIMAEISCPEDPFEGVHLDDAIENFGCNNDEKMFIPQQSCDFGKVSLPDKNCADSGDSATKESHHNGKLPVPEKNLYGGRFYMKEEKAEFKNPMWTPTYTRRKTEDNKDVEKEGSDIDDVDADSSTTDDLEIHPQENDFEEPDIAIQTEETKLKLAESQKSSFSQNSVNVIDTNKEVVLVEETPAFVMKTDTPEEETLSLRTSDPSLTQTPECQIITEDNMRAMGSNAAPSLTTTESLDILEKTVNGLIQRAILDQINADRKGNISEPCNTTSQTFHEIDDLEEADRGSTQESLSILAPLNKEGSKIQIIAEFGNEKNNNSENEDGIILKPKINSKRKCFSLEISPVKVISSKFIKIIEDVESECKDVTDSVRRKTKRGRLGRTKGKESQFSEQSDSSSAVLVLETQSENGDRAQKQWIHQAIESQECVPETVLDSIGTGTFQGSLEGVTLQNSSIKDARGENSSQSETVLESLCQDSVVDMNITVEKYKKNMNDSEASSTRAVSDFCPVLNPVPVLETQNLDSHTGSYDIIGSLEHESDEEIKNKSLKNIKVGKKTLNTFDGRNSVNKFSGISLEAFTDLELMDTQISHVVESSRDKTKTDAQTFKGTQSSLHSFGIRQVEDAIEREQSACSPEDIFQMDSEVPMLVESPKQLELDELPNRYFVAGNKKYPVESHLHNSKSAMEKIESKSTLEELSELDFGAKSLQPVPRSPFCHSALNSGSSISPMGLSRKSSLDRQSHTTEKNQGTVTPKQVPVDKTKFKSKTTPPKSSPDARSLRSRIEKLTPSGTSVSLLPCTKEELHDSSASIPMNSPQRLDDNFHQSTIYGGKEKMLTPPLSAKNLSMDLDTDSDLSQDLKKRRKSGIRGVRGFSSKKCKKGISENSDGSVLFSAKGLCENSPVALCRFDSKAEKVSHLSTVSNVEAGSSVNQGCEYENTGKTSVLRTLTNASCKYQNATNTIDACKQDIVSKERINNERTSPLFALKSPHMSQHTPTKKYFLHGQSEIDYKTKHWSWKRKQLLNKLEETSEMTCMLLDNVELKSHIVDVDEDLSVITDKPHGVDIKAMNYVESQDNPLNPESFDEPHCPDIQPLDVDNELHYTKADFNMEASKQQERNELNASVVKPLTVDCQSNDINVDHLEVDNELEDVKKNSQTIDEDVHVDITVPDSYPASGSFQVQSQTLSTKKSWETLDLDDFRNEAISEMIDNIGEAVQRTGMKKMVDHQITKVQASNDYLQQRYGDYNDNIGKTVTVDNDGLRPDDADEVDTLQDFEFEDELLEEKLNLGEEGDHGDIADSENIVSVGRGFETSSPIPKITGAKVIEINESFVDDDYESDEPVRSKRQRTRVLEDSDSDDAKSQDSSTSHYMNLTSSSAISSQSETLTTQQRDVLERDLERMRKEMQEIEAQLAANRVSSRKSDSGESRKWLCDPSPSARRNLLSEEMTKDASVKESNLDKDNDLADVELIADSQKQVAGLPEIDKDSHIETEDSGEDGDDLFLSPLPLSPESLPSPVGQDRSRTHFPDIMQNVENLFSEIREQMAVEDECKSPDEKGRMVKQEKRNIKSQKSPKMRPPLNDIKQISSNIPENTASRPCARGFVASGLSVGQAQEVRKLASLNDCKFYNTFNPSVSHVIVRSDKQNNRLCDRTLKFFQGIAHHCWIVRFQWVIDSRTAGHLLPEDAYEIQGDTANGNIHFGPKRSRLSNSSLVGQFAFYCTGESPGLTA